MRVRVTSRFGLMILCSAVIAWAGSSSVADDDQEPDIRRVIQYYFDGHATGKAEVMRKAFHPETRLIWVKADGTYASRTLEDWLSGFKGAPAADENQRQRRIVSIDVAGSSAVAKLELDYPSANIIDYMTLLHLDDGWKIVHKSFYWNPKSKE